MITSRSFNDLYPPVAERARQLVEKCREIEIEIVITSTYRDYEAQERLYVQGRTLPGQIVTYNKAGSSWHNWNRAFDFVPILNGKPVWSIRGYDKDVYMKVGQIGESLGLEWGGSWPRHPEYEHFQDTTGKTIYLMKKAADSV